MTPWLSDPDVDIYVGDALEVLRGLPDGSVDCCVTSPPYWGLRDYGTGAWDGGDPDFRDPCPDCAWPNPDERTFRNPDHCDTCLGARTVPHRAHDTLAARGGRGGSGAPGKQTAGAFPAEFAADVCRCGAQRVDRQLGLEATPDLYVAAMVAVFAEVRRVLADHGTLWLNIGDSYAASPPGNVAGVGATSGLHGANDENGVYRDTLKAGHATKRNTVVGGLKPKDLCGIPWRLAFALQADGWWLRSDIIWAKPNPMPESVTDRPTKAHEYVFLLSKRPSYWFDQEAVREEREPDSLRRSDLYGSNPSFAKWNPDRNDGGFNGNPAGRNVRSVWEIATQPYPEAHFATFPEELPRRAILAGCPEWVCATCGKARERIVERPDSGGVSSPGYSKFEGQRKDNDRRGPGTSMSNNSRKRLDSVPSTLGWSTCDCPPLEIDDGRTVTKWRPGIVLDPFLGSGTTAHVARKHGRRCVGIELNETYAELAARRLQQLSLLAEWSSY